jgi:XTP/dITP diphosphohydrolase
MSRKFSGEELVIATHNKGKLEEFRALLKGVTLSCAADHGLPSPDETGATFLENAKLKALFVAQTTGLPALADDSGVCADALDGAPGIYTADWAETPHGRDFAMAMQKLNDALGNEPNRKAHFTCCLVLAWPDGHIESAEGYAHGTLVWPPRGDKGHGYDPMFLPDTYNRTYGEMDERDKNAISHRAAAFALLKKKCF